MVFWQKVITAVVMFCFSCAFANDLSWKIKRSWNSSEEQLYSEFVEKIGIAVKKGYCLTTDECLRNQEANPLFFNQNPSGLRVIKSDCADLPFILRGYFAFMRGLPFSFPKRMTFFHQELEQTLKEFYQVKHEYDQYGFFSRPREIKERYRYLKAKIRELRKETGKDIRYSRSGNKVAEKVEIQGGENLNAILDQIVMTVSTASFRANASMFDHNELYRVTYPVEISRDSIVPGTILYDPAGHIALVAKVEENGKIYLIDAHPDNSITYISYGEKFSRSSVHIGAGFLKWRPLSFEEGRYRPTRNSDLEDYSLVQYFGSDLINDQTWRKSEFFYEGEKLDFYTFVRANLSLTGLKVDPIEEARSALKDLCRDIGDRVQAIDKAVEAGINQKRHPDVLPDNIYGTHGEWETYSTPSRDARLKASVREMNQMFRLFLGLEENRNGFEIDHSGESLKSDLKKVIDRENQNCQINIHFENGDSASIRMSQVVEKLFDLSFDPYHCVALRWGMMSPCQDESNKWEWYQAQRKLRNQVDRNYTLFMGYELDDLPGANIGVSESPDVNFFRIFE